MVMSDLTTERMLEVNELIEAEARVNYFQCAPREFSGPFRLEVKRIGSIFVTMMPAVDHAMYNRILGLGVSEPATETRLDEAIAVFQKAGCKNYRTEVGPFILPTQYPEWLAARGFKQGGRNWAKMYRGTEPAPEISSDLRIETIGKEQAEAFANVLLHVFGITPAYRPLVKGVIGKPGWQHYLAFDGKKPVSTAAMFIKGEVAWVGHMSTLKNFRKRGGQRAMFARCIEDGLALGCKWFVAETEEDTPEEPNPSYRNMLRSGFKLAYMRRNHTHRSPESPQEKIGRALFISFYSLKFDCQRRVHQKSPG
jgi:hypothetical protein